MSSPQVTDSTPQVRLLHACLEGIKKKNMAHVAKYLHKDHLRITHPQSVEKPEQTKEEYLRHSAELLSLLTDIEVNVHSIIIDIPGTLVVHQTITGNTSLGVKMIREVILILQIVTDEDGSMKVKRAEEFTDSKSYLDFSKATAEAIANRQNEPSTVA